MTPASSITVSLEWAKKLKEAGLEQNSEFWWNQPIGDREFISYWKTINHNTMPITTHWAAPTAEEILMKLPEVLYLGEEREAVYLSVMPDDYKWICLYSPEYDQRRCDKENFWKRSKDSLADACANMYCYLADNNLLPK